MSTSTYHPAKDTPQTVFSISRSLICDFLTDLVTGLNDHYTITIPHTISTAQTNQDVEYKDIVKIIRLEKCTAMLFNDADGCYDRIAPILGEIAIRRIGCLKEIAKTVTSILEMMKHHIKKSTGVSTGYIQYSKE